MHRGLLIYIYRTMKFGDASNGGVSATHDEALVIGEGIPEIFEAKGRPVLRLEKNRETPTVRLVPVDVEHRWTMFGGNFGHTSDSRFSEAIEAILGHRFYGAVAIHDRVEQGEGWR